MQYYFMHSFWISSAHFSISLLSDGPAQPDVLLPYLSPSMQMSSNFSLQTKSTWSGVNSPAVMVLINSSQCGPLLETGERLSCGGWRHPVDSGIHPSLYPEGSFSINYPCIHIRASCPTLVSSPQHINIFKSFPYLGKLFGKSLFMLMGGRIWKLWWEGIWVKKRLWFITVCDSIFPKCLQRILLF